MPHPPHHHPPQPQEKNPISPPLDSLPHHKKPEEKKGGALIYGLLFGTIITAIVGGALWYFGISVNVILPVLAPIWVGSITLVYSVSSKN